MVEDFRQLTEGDERLEYSVRPGFSPITDDEILGSIAGGIYNAGVF